MCVEGKGRCAYARVLIEISATKPWEEYIDVQTWDLNTMTGIKHSVQLEYSWVPTRCDKCKVYDNSKSTCPLQVMENTPANTNTTNTTTPIFGASVDKDGFKLVTKRKGIKHATRGRNRGPQKATNPKPTNNTNANQNHMQQMEDFQNIATNFASNIEKNKEPLTTQENQDKATASTSGSNVVNNVTYIAETTTGTSEEDMQSGSFDLNIHMEEDILKQNQFAALITNEDEEELVITNTNKTARP
ncbi:hypothetical protein LXL04_027438 [Taraxacum kok-saghyz]